MSAAVVFFEFLAWLYLEGIGEVLKAWANLHWFFYYLFAVPLLLRTLFLPLKRIHEKYARGMDLELFFEAAAVNLIMRAAGFTARGVILILGAVAQIVAAVAGASALVLFIASPVIIPFGLLLGLIFLIF